MLNLVEHPSEREAIEVSRLLLNLLAVPELEGAIRQCDRPFIQAMDDYRAALHIPCPDEGIARRLSGHDWGWAFVPFDGKCSQLVIDSPDEKIVITPEDPRKATFEQAARQVLGLSEGAFDVDVESTPWEWYALPPERFAPVDSVEGFPFICVSVDCLATLDRCCQHQDSLQQLGRSIVAGMYEVAIAYCPQSKGPLDWGCPILSIPATGSAFLRTGEVDWLAVGLLAEAGVSLPARRDHDNPGFMDLDVAIDESALMVSGDSTAGNAVARTLERLRQLLQELKCLPGLRALERLELKAAGETQSFALR